IPFKYIRKETADNYIKSIITQCPSSVFTATPTPKVFARDQDVTRIGIVIQYKLSSWIIVRIITPIAEQIFTKTIPCSRFQKACRNDLIGVNIFRWLWYRPRFYVFK